jgi:UDP-glucose:glycoprotein glucosyltransferase
MDFEVMRNMSRINVFTVPSGLASEHLMKMMMLSVRRSTRFPLKFWILDHFMSQNLRNSIHEFAARFNFTCELVSYPWPPWIPSPRDHNQLVGLMRFLFLDVMFPPDLDRVIYIDPTQIVRTDLIDLARMHINDWPFALPPMCESNAPPGEWPNVLKNKTYKYHNSEFFLVDLPSFKRSSGADWTRLVFHQLVGEMGRQEHADQDVLNVVQDRVPVFSLPQEWLWCDSWCPAEDMQSAKVLSIFPSLDGRPRDFEGAKDLIPEWAALRDNVTSL